MPKTKSHKGSLKRFKATANGKLKRSQAGKKHLNGPKTGKRKRQLRAPMVNDHKIAKRYVKILHMGE